VCAIWKATESATALLAAIIIAPNVSGAGTALMREPIAAERTFIHALLRNGKISDESRRRIERDLDLEQASLSNREHRKIPL
jgi:CPA1 family monovalent cation:H+ antiporter